MGERSNILQRSGAPNPYQQADFGPFGAKKLRIISQGAAAWGKDDIPGTVGTKPSNRSYLSGSDGRHNTSDNLDGIIACT